MSDRVSFGFMAVIDAPIGDAVERTKEALKAEGFGVLTSIDVQDTMKQKLNVDTEPYVILGACNPGLAYRALQAECSLPQWVDLEADAGMLHQLDLDAAAIQPTER